MKFNNIWFEVNNEQRRFFNVPNEKNEEILNALKNIINRDMDLYESACEIDAKKLDKELLLKQINVKYNPENEVFRNEYGRVSNTFVPYGVLGVMSDSNIYDLLRVMVISIVTRNGLIINLKDNVGANYLIINSVNEALKEYGSEKLIGIYGADSEEEVIENFEKLDGIIYIGKKTSCERLKLIGTVPVIYSGCKNYEVYVESAELAEGVKELYSMTNVKIYSNESVGIGNVVANVEQAIAKINEEGNGYSTSIITKSVENSGKFIDGIKSKNVFVNASPTLIGNELDLTPESLTYKKSVLVHM